MIRKIYVILLLVLCMLALHTPSSFASFYDDNSGDSWEDAYIIDSPEDLLLMSRTPGNLYGKFFKLEADIDVSSYSEFKGMEFSGRLDGQGHTITINIDRRNNTDEFDISLFHRLSNDGIIRNLNVKGSIRGTSQYMAGIVGCSDNGTVIENSTFTGTIEYINASSSFPIGGIIGEASDNTIIRNCTFDGSIIIKPREGYLELSTTVGGIAGNCGYRAKIENCNIKSGSVICIVPTQTLRNRFVWGLPNVSLTAGGIVGICYMKKSGDTLLYEGEIKNCTSSMRITGAYNTGGVIGSASDEMDTSKFLSNSWLYDYPVIGKKHYSFPSAKFSPVSQSVRPGQAITPVRVSSHDNFAGSLTLSFKVSGDTNLGLVNEGSRINGTIPASTSSDNYQVIVTASDSYGNYISDTVKIWVLSNNFSVNKNNNNPSSVKLGETAEADFYVTSRTINGDKPLFPYINWSIEEINILNDDGEYSRFTGNASWIYLLSTNSASGQIVASPPANASELVRKSFQVILKAEARDGNEGEILNDSLRAEWTFNVTQGSSTYKGSGTKDDPYEIASVEDFALLRTESIYKYYKLTANINLTETSISDIDINFSGDFDGQNYTLIVNDSLFNKNYGTIRNLNIRGELGNNFNFISGGIIKENSGLVENCSFTGSVGFYNDYYLGGIAGINGGVIRNCTFSGDINGYNAVRDIGGIAGASSGLIEYCKVNSGSIISISSGDNNYNHYAGGIVGSSMKVHHCVSYAEITGANYIGGIVGSAGGVNSVFYSNKWPEKYSQAGDGDVPTLELKPSVQLVIPGNEIKPVKVRDKYFERGVLKWSFKISEDNSFAFSSHDDIVTGTIPSNTPYEDYTLIINAYKDINKVFEESSLIRVRNYDYSLNVVNAPDYVEVGRSAQAEFSITGNVPFVRWEIEDVEILYGTDEYTHEEDWEYYNKSTDWLRLSQDGKITASPSSEAGEQFRVTLRAYILESSSGQLVDDSISAQWIFNVKGNSGNYWEQHSGGSWNDAYILTSKNDL